MKEEKRVALEVSGLSKKYIIKKINPPGNEEFWALKDVSFVINHGDVVSIIGNNGSGKSTLLKLLSHITLPTEGTAKFHGSSTSILDIGNNFHPDLSGRDNVLLQLKLSKIPNSEFEEIIKKIQEFAEIGDFFNQPVKYYSNGMYLRLAFTLAFHLSADILFLDEVLSVGDEGFRLKCQELLKMFTMQGKTILFVSHSRLEILELSNKCIWLEKGTIKKIGDPAIMLGEYFSIHRDKFEQDRTTIEPSEDDLKDSPAGEGTVWVEWDKRDAPSNEMISMYHISVTSANTHSIIYSNEPIEIKFLFEKYIAEILVSPFFFLQDIFYQPVLLNHLSQNTPNKELERIFKQKTGIFEVSCIIPANFLIPGKYYLHGRIGVEEGEWTPTSQESMRFADHLSFIVHPSSEYQDMINDPTKGAVRPPFEWKMKNVE